MRRNSSFGGSIAPKLIATVLKQAVMIVVAVTCLFPIYYMLVNSFKSQIEYRFNILAPATHPTFSNFTNAFRTGQQFFTWLTNSTLITFFSVVVSLLFAALAAYAFSNMRFKLKRILLNFAISLMVIPAIVMIIPLFRFFVRLGIINTLPTVILIYVGLILPFSIYMLTSFFSTVPKDILDAAFIDGCSHLSILFTIIIPLSKPAIITSAIVNALWVWNELLIAMVFLQSDRLRTLMASILLFKSRNQLNVPLIMSGLLIASIPMFILFIVGIRYFMKGMYAGSIKA